MRVEAVEPPLLISLPALLHSRLEQFQCPFRGRNAHGVKRQPKDQPLRERRREMGVARDQRLLAVRFEREAMPEPPGRIRALKGETGQRDIFGHFQVGVERHAVRLSRRAIAAAHTGRYRAKRVNLKRVGGPLPVPRQVGYIFKDLCRRGIDDDMNAKGCRGHNPFSISKDQDFRLNLFLGFAVHLPCRLAPSYLLQNKTTYGQKGRSCGKAKSVVQRIPNHIQH